MIKTILLWVLVFGAQMKCDRLCIFVYNDGSCMFTTHDMNDDDENKNKFFFFCSTEKVVTHFTRTAVVSSFYSLLIHTDVLIRRLLNI